MPAWVATRRVWCGAPARRRAPAYGGGPGAGRQAYGSRANRARLRRRGIRCTILERSIRSVTGRTRAAPGAARPPLTRVVQAAPRRGMRHRQAQAQPRRRHPATTSWPSATRPPPISPQSTNGSTRLLNTPQVTVSPSILLGAVEIGREDVDSASALLPWFCVATGVGSALGSGLTCYPV